jgi:hypothetical protein
VGPPGDLDDLLRVGKVDPGRNTHDLELPVRDPSVTLLPAGVGYRASFQGGSFSCWNKVGWLALTVIR